MYLFSFQPNEGNEVESNKEKLQFAFEYLFGKDELKWVTIESDQAIMMSMALQGIVDEILREKRGEGIRMVCYCYVLMVFNQFGVSPKSSTVIKLK